MKKKSDRTFIHNDTAIMDHGCIMDSVAQRVLDQLTEVEEAAEDVLTTKEQVTKYFLGNNTMLIRGVRPPVRTDVSANGTGIENISS